MRSRQLNGRALPRFHVSRPRLVRRLSSALECKLTVVCANAGYGKTTLLAEFVTSSGLRAEWYHLTSAHRDVVRLAEALGDRLRHLAPGMEWKGARRFRSGRIPAPSVAVLSESLQKQAALVGPEPAILVLDDYQAVDQETDVNLLVGLLIENSPASLHFVVLSRSAPRFPVARLRGRQELCELTEDDLAFTLDETSRFLKDENGFDLPDAAVALIHQRTEGWAAGIAMVSQSLRYGDQDKVMEILADPAASAWLVYDYLAEEVFDKQEPSVQDFLARTSILSRMTAPSCDHLLGTGSSRLALITLEERGVFTASIDPSRQTFRYHQLYREFLRQKLHQRETGEAIEALHLRAAEFYQRREEWEDCIHHYLSAGAPVRAAEVVEALGERHIFSGFSQTVERWLRSLPEELSATRPWLLCLRGRLSHMSVRHDDALRLLERGLRLFQVNRDESGQVWAAGEIAYVKYRSGQPLQALHHFKTALAMVKEPGMLKSQLLVMQAMAYRDGGMVEESAKACIASVDELAGVDDVPSRLWGLSRATRNLALAEMELGNTAEAVRIARGAVQFCTDHQLGEYEQSWVLASLGGTLWASGEMEEAIEVSGRALSMAGRYIRHLQLFIGYWLGNALRDSERYSESEQAYSQSSRAACLESVYAALLAGRAHAMKSAASDLYREYQQAESVVDRSTALVVFSIVLRECGEIKRAVELIREGTRLLKAHGYGFRLAGALLHQSRMEYELSRVSEGRDSLAQAFELGAAHGYYHFFWWDPQLLAYLVGRALAEDVFPDYAADLAARRLDGPAAANLIPLAQHRRPEVRRRAQAVLASLSQRDPLSMRERIFADCNDPRVRNSLLRAAKDGLISAEGVEVLHAARGLSWREIEMLVEYYLRAATSSFAVGDQARKECAQRLNVSEHTVRCHINNVRRKLALPRRVSGKGVLDWAREEGLLPMPE